MFPQSYRSALADLARHIGVDEAALLRNQELVIDGTSVVLSYAVEPLGGVIQGACLVGRLESCSVSDALCRLLLQANVLTAETGYATFGMHYAGGHIVLARRMPLDAPVEALARTWRGLATAAQAWTLAIDRGVDAQAEVMFS